VCAERPIRLKGKKEERTVEESVGVDEEEK
jgi:hypothetical protein